MGIWNKKINLNITGTSFTDELHSDVGASTFTLNHDWFMNDTGEALIIRTAGGGGGALLIEDTDYTISNQDTYLTTEAGVDTYSTVQIINAAYQTGNLYFSGKYVADSVDAEDNIETGVDVSTTGTVSYDYLPVELCTSGADGIRRTLPDATTCEHLKITFIKVDTGTGAVTIVPYSTQTIGTMSYIFLFEQNERITIISDGSNWLIMCGSLTMKTGGINTNDWTNRELGDASIPYDGATGTALVIGEKVTEETSNNTGIIVYKTATVLTLKKVTGTGIFTNDRTLTGSMGGGTVEVNIPGSTSKNADGNFYHGFGIESGRITKELWISPNATFSWTNAEQITGVLVSGASTFGSAFKNVDTNNNKLQTATSGVGELSETGTNTYYATDDYSYNIVERIVF